MKVFVTGTAGFIGYHVAARLLDSGHEVTGFDGITEYYDPALKRARHAMLVTHSRFTPVEAMLEDGAALRDSVTRFGPEVIIHLAAQPGVRYSLDHPETYISSNLVGTANLLEAARQAEPGHLMIASSSSVYGGNEDKPFREVDRTDFPMSLYAATKKGAEAMSHSYAHLFQIPTTCFRFFTVYGPWGRPDMALFKFVKAIYEDEPIDVYGHGQLRRDFTYIDDLVDGITSLIDKRPSRERAVPSDSLSTVAPFRTVNLASGSPVGLMDFIEAIERATGRIAQKNFLPRQPGDVVETHADPQVFHELVGSRPAVNIDEGVARFVEWYTGHYSVPNH